MKPDIDLTLDALTYNNNDKTFLLEIYQKINEMIYVINNKDSAIYSNEQFYTSGKWYINNNPQYPTLLLRKVISFGALPNNTTKSVAHEINGANPTTNDWIIIPIAGRSFNPTTNFTIPIPKPDIDLSIDSTYINITTIGDYSNFTTTEIIILFIQP